MSPDQIKPVSASAHQLGEGALWDAENQRLFYIDIIGKHLYEYYPESGKQVAHPMPSMIGTVVCETAETVLVALEDGIYRYHLGNKSLDFFANPPENDENQRFNDGKTDPAGRFWVGTMSLVGGKETSHLFRLDNSGEVEAMLDGITISNGIVWNSAKDRMYYIDTPTRKVMEYHYDHVTGEISKPRVAVEIDRSMGAPDGMAIDAEDRLWVCMWGGSAVYCFDPVTGKMVDKVPVPAKNVTSCAFGGADFNTLYITTAKAGTSKDEMKKWPDAGKLFRIKVNYRGIASNCYHFNVKK